MKPSHLNGTLWLQYSEAFFLMSFPEGNGRYRVKQLSLRGIINPKYKCWINSMNIFEFVYLVAIIWWLHACRLIPRWRLWSELLQDGDFEISCSKMETLKWVAPRWRLWSELLQDGDFEVSFSKWRLWKFIAPRWRYTVGISKTET